ncbi:MAG: hypothetical protein LBR61_12370 [Synergistaceae bacterium]|jgi:hypothetical protein|nr:hypothetical protein [Synergistaceae bacterium]
MPVSDKQIQWTVEVSATGLDNRKTTRLMALDDVNLALFEARYVERARGSQASFRKFRETWEGEANRLSLRPRAHILPVKDVFGEENSLFQKFSLPKTGCLASVWTLGPGAEPGEIGEADAAVALLLDMAATFLLFGIWRQVILPWARELLKPAGPCIAKTLQPDSDSLRSVFALKNIGDAGVTLNPSGAMVPAKSRCALILAGNAEEKKGSGRCSSCDPRCIYGELNLCPHLEAFE